MNNNGSQPEAADFVSSWLRSKKEQGDMNAMILDAVGRHRSSDGLNERGLVEDLLKLADREESADAAS